MDIKGTIAAVFGGASGIGLATVEKLLNRNVKGVAIFDLPSSAAEDAATKLQSRFAAEDVVFIPCDVTKQDQVDNGFKKLLATFGGVDIVINSAGIYDYERWNSMIDINLGGVVRTSLAALQVMGKHKGHKGGTVLNIASVAGLMPFAFTPIYAATKYGVVTFDSALKENTLKTGVRILTICPGMTTTPLTLKLKDEPKQDFVDHEKVLALKYQVIWQQPQVVAKTIVDLIERGKNGAICVIENSEPPYLVSPPTLLDLSRTPF